MSKSPNKPPYITVGHYAQRAAMGTADSIKNITLKTHKEITRLFEVIDPFSLQHIPFDEVMVFWAAKNMEIGMHSQLSMVMMKKQMSLHPCHLA
jgi:hypothetical protein